MNKNNLTIPISIIIAGLIIGVAVYLKSPSDKNGSEKSKNDNKKINLIKNVPPITEKDHVLGNPDAEITMIEYSDTECPFCKRFHTTMQQVMEEFGKQGKVRWVYRHFPLDMIHTKARKEAEATECAAEIGGEEKFWEYLNKIFEITPSNDGLDLALLPQIAKDIGLDEAEFKKCLESGTTSEKVQADYEGGVKAGVRGTPHTIVISKDGEMFSINGAFPYEESSPGLYYRLSEEQRDVLCSEETKLCGVKIAIEKILNK